ncbi:hypothetical protein M673_22610 (plasmid) [Aureimonas sp. AU20]|nr:hypothetical protein M673_22610 [Aureimonas sp. AU20]
MGVKLARMTQPLRSPTGFRLAFWIASAFWLGLAIVLSLA